MHLPFVDNCEQLRFVNTSAPTPQDRYRVQAKLARDEQIVWLGRPVPSFRYKGWRFNLLFGVVWLIPTGLALTRWILPMWFAGKAKPSVASFGDTVLPTVLVVVFAFIGFVILLSPLLYWFGQRMQLYAVTDKRAIIVGRPFSFSFPASKLRQEPTSRENARNGLVKLFFATKIVLEGRPPELSKYKEVPIGFENISPADADAAEQAIRRLKRTPPSTP